MSEKIIWRYGVQGYGIKKRCRKVDFFSSEKNLHNDTTTPDYGVAVTLAKDWLRDNMKQVQKASATVTQWTIQPNGVEQWQPFTESHNVKIPLNLNPMQAGE